MHTQLMLNMQIQSTEIKFNEYISILMTMLVERNI